MKRSSSVHKDYIYSAHMLKSDLKLISTLLYCSGLFLFFFNNNAFPLIHFCLISKTCVCERDSVCSSALDSLCSNLCLFMCIQVHCVVKMCSICGWKFLPVVMILLAVVSTLANLLLLFPGFTYKYLTENHITPEATWCTGIWASGFVVSAAVRLWF